MKIPVGSVVAFRAGIYRDAYGAAKTRSRTVRAADLNPTTFSPNTRDSEGRNSITTRPFFDEANSMASFGLRARRSFEFNANKSVYDANADGNDNR